MNAPRETPRKGRILSHPKDIHCVIFHLLCVLAYALAFWIYLNPETAGLDDAWSTAAFVGAAALMLGWISGIDVGVNFHNHTHRRIFRIPWLNRWFGRFWTFTGGWPSFFWQHLHTVVHHASVMSDDDWTLPRKRADGSFEGFYRYCLFHWPFRYSVHLLEDMMVGRGGNAVPGRAKKEFGIFLVLYSIPFWIDPVMALFLWVLPHYLANVLVMGPGMYVQHADCQEPDAVHPLRHSNTFLSKFFNKTMFNIGYHIEHHTHGNVHWAELPELHERMKDDMLADGCHIVPFGYYKAGRLLCTPINSRQARAQWARNAPGYEVPEEAEAVAAGATARLEKSSA